MPAGVIVQGVVRDTTTCEPVAHVEVRELAPVPGNQGVPMPALVADTDAAGTYKLVGVTPGWHVFVFHYGRLGPGNVKASVDVQQPLVEVDIEIDKAWRDGRAPLWEPESVVPRCRQRIIGI